MKKVRSSLYRWIAYHLFLIDYYESARCISEFFFREFTIGSLIELFCCPFFSTPWCRYLLFSLMVEYYHITGDKRNYTVLIFSADSVIRMASYDMALVFFRVFLAGNANNSWLIAGGIVLLICPMSDIGQINKTLSLIWLFQKSSFIGGKMTVNYSIE